MAAHAEPAEATHKSFPLSSSDPPKPPTLLRPAVTRQTRQRLRKVWHCHRTVPQSNWSRMKGVDWMAHTAPLTAPMSHFVINDDKNYSQTSNKRKLILEFWKGVDWMAPKEHTPQLYQQFWCQYLKCPIGHIYAVLPPNSYNSLNG